MRVSEINNSDRLQAIKDRVAKAIPGPWFYEIKRYDDGDQDHEWTAEICLMVGDEDNMIDFIAANQAHDTIGGLKAEERLRIESAPTFEFLSNSRDDIIWLIEQLDAMRTEITSPDDKKT